MTASQRKPAPRRPRPFGSSSTRQDPTPYLQDTSSPSCGSSGGSSGGDSGSSSSGGGCDGGGS
ncbi:hypothetical protein SM8_032185 [Streptomyces sp. SM8]|nr:hypothetical protein SM8_032185 [Streptomyces sp. SM8]